MEKVELRTCFKIVLLLKNHIAPVDRLDSTDGALAMQCTEYPNGLSDELWRLIKKRLPEEKVRDEDGGRLTRFHPVSRYSPRSPTKRPWRGAGDQHFLHGKKSATSSAATGTYYCHSMGLKPSPSGEPFTGRGSVDETHD